MFIGPHFVITVRHGDAVPAGPVRRRPGDQAGPAASWGRGRWSTRSSTGSSTRTSKWPTRSRTTSTRVEASVFARQCTAAIAADLPAQARAGGVQAGGHAAAAAARRAIGRGRPGACRSEVRRYFRDVKTTCSRTVEQVVSYDDLLNSILQARLAQVTVDQNNDMRKIASWAGHRGDADRDRRRLRHELRRTCRSCTGGTAIRSCCW